MQRLFDRMFWFVAVVLITVYNVAPYDDYDGLCPINYTINDSGNNQLLACSFLVQPFVQPAISEFATGRDVTGWTDQGFAGSMAITRYSSGPQDTDKRSYLLTRQLPPAWIFRSSSGFRGPPNPA